jgi:hypothetical protein
VLGINEILIVPEVITFCTLGEITGFKPLALELLPTIVKIE